MDLTVAVIGKPVGLRGYVALEIRTDQIGKRFAKGSVLRVSDPKLAPLTVVGLRKQGGRVVAAFAELNSLADAELYRGTHLVIDSDTESEPDGYYRHQLQGLKVRNEAGESLGEVTDLFLGEVQDLIEVRVPEGQKVLIPFVKQIVLQVDLSAKEIVIAPPVGLLEVTEEMDSPDED